MQVKTFDSDTDYESKDNNQPEDDKHDDCAKSSAW